jgi:hypothetical protein
MIPPLHEVAIFTAVFTIGVVPLWAMVRSERRSRRSYTENHRRQLEALDRVFTKDAA